ncbi:MAG: ChrR family anti-sigma-E factor [Hyphomicrobiaceae bacterium]|nr:ChrR family anti-sigma-E factor [Hyphomicrobiaceae bacterium]
MKIAHHVDDATLMSFVAGSLPEALSAVVSTHLAVCGECRAKVGEMECIGSALLTELMPSAMAAAVPRTPQRDPRPVVDEGDEILAAVERSGDIPGPLSRLVGSDLSSVRWKRLGLGVWHLPIPLTGASHGDLRLLKISPGQVMPEHGHGGTELTMVLAGSYTDEIGTYHPGDVADLDGEVEHSPVADRKLGCICLIASEEKARFKGAFARFVQPLTGM